MRLTRIAGEGIQALGTNKLRTFFMMAGTIVGVAAIVVILAIGKVTEKKVNKRMQHFGPRAMMLIAGGGKDLPPPDMTVTTLTLEDAEAVRNEIEDVELVSPMAWRFRMNVTRDANQHQAVVWGVEPNWHDAWNWRVVAGEGIEDEDVATMARVCVVGETVRRELFGPHVDSITIGGTWLENETLTITMDGVPLVITTGSLVTTSQVATTVMQAFNGTPLTDTSASSSPTITQGGGQAIPQLSGFTASIDSSDPSKVLLTADSTEGKPCTVTVTGTSTRGTATHATEIVGKRLYINNVALTVKGVLESRGTSPMGGDFDSRVIIPITTAMRRVMNVDYVGAIRIITKDHDLMTQQAKEIRELIHDRHGINEAEEDDFRIITAKIIARLARGTSGTLSMLLIALATLSLIVGGIVMMNILLISVAERTNEIGVRRAVGATRNDVFIQFLTEALVVTLLGVILGGLLGVGASALWLGPRLLAIFSDLSLSFVVGLVLALLVALLVGTISGVLPARRAAKLHPVEALR